jgi:hypothetical protein
MARKLYFLPVWISRRFTGWLYPETPVDHGRLLSTSRPRINRAELRRLSNLLFSADTRSLNYFTHSFDLCFYQRRKCFR